MNYPPQDTGIRSKEVQSEAMSSSLIKKSKTTNKKPEHKEAKNHRNVSSAHLHYMSKPTALKLVIY